MLVVFLVIPITLQDDVRESKNSNKTLFKLHTTDRNMPSPGLSGRRLNHFQSLTFITCSLMAAPA